MQTKAMITLVCVCVCVLVKTRLLTSKTVQIRVSCKAPIPTIGRPFGEKEEEFLDMRLVCYCYYYLFFFCSAPSLLLYNIHHSLSSVSKPCTASTVLITNCLPKELLSTMLH